MNISKYYIVLIVTLLSISICSCNLESSKSESKINSDTVAFNIIALRDTIKADRSFGNQNFIIDINIQRPISYNGKNIDSALTGIICNRIFSNSFDDFSKAANDMKVTYINTFKDALSNTLPLEAEENKPKYEYTFKAYPIFNEGGVLSYDVYTYTFIGGANGDKKNKYFSVDINTSSIIELENLFTQDTYDNINVLLCDQLKKQLNIKSNDQLIDNGYYDINSITINDNFYISKDGIVWAYNPCEIACYAIGEVKICLSYKVLKNLFIPNSAINKFLEESNT